MSDDDPKRPKGTKQWRVTRAIHEHFTTDKTFAEIGDDLGVSEDTVRRYVHSPPADEVRKTLQSQATQVRMAAFAELKRQLRAAGQRSRTAETPLKVYETADGDVEVRDVRDDETGELLTKKPVPQDIDLLPDEEARFYARKEAREILEQLIDLVGAGEPEQIELSGAVESGLSDDAEERLERLSNTIEHAYD